MNIALLPSAFYPSLGGVEELTRQLALELKRQGHQVIILTNRWPRSLPRHELINGIPVYRLAFRTPDANAKAKLSYALSHRLVLEKMLHVLRRHRADFLHVQCVSSNAYYALKAQSRLGLPLVVTLQGELTMDASQLFQRSEFARETLRQCVLKAELVTGCSGKTLLDAEEFLGHRIAGSRVIFNAAEMKDFADTEPYRHARPYIFSLGRMVPQKGFDLLLRALADAGVESHDLLIAGDGPEKAALEIQARELGLGERVRFVGRADRTQVAALFSGCSFFVLPSRADEGLPVVCAEAMAAGKAVIATRSGGAPEAVIHGETGLIVEKGDVEGLSNAIRQMVNDPIHRESMARAGKERSSLFSWETVAAEYVKAYEASAKGAAGQKEQVAALV